MKAAVVILLTSTAAAAFVPRTRLRSATLWAEHQGADGAVIEPIYQCSTFTFTTAEEGERAFAIAYGIVVPEPDEEVPYIYSRVGNPNMNSLERRITKWDGAEQACVFSSGMAATSTTCLALLRPGDRMLASDPMYGGTEHLFRHVLPAMGIEVDFFPAGASQKAVAELLRKAPYSLVWVENPCNPLLTLTSIRAMASAIQDSGSSAMLAVDNTFAGPLFHHPLEHGADLVMYSMTKFFGGHSDLIAGCVMGNAETMSLVKDYRTILGPIPSPQTCWLLSRSLDTLELRMRQQAQSTARVVDFLRSCDQVKNLHYPGLKDDPVFDAEFEGAGSLIAFEMVGGKDQAFRLLNAVKVWTLAVSLGGAESLVEHPASMTHACMTSEQLEHAGVVPGLIRCSVGLEDPEALIADLAAAMEASCSRKGSDKDIATVLKQLESTLSLPRSAEDTSYRHMATYESDYSI